MFLINLQDISIKFSDKEILKEVNFTINPKERVCLIGRNGSGKSTLMNIINKKIQPDYGEVNYGKHLQIANLDQQLASPSEETVFNFIKGGLNKQEQRIELFQSLSDKEHTEDVVKLLANLQEEIETAGGWNLDLQIDSIVSKLDLPAHKKLAELSGGWLRRVALGKALVGNPDLLILDEPTNHLDINAIEWLEHTLKKHPASLLFVTHDRNFLQNIATRIIEIDRTKLLNWPGTYNNYLELKAEANVAEDNQTHVFNRKLSQEEEWVRKGVKARRTRNVGRVKELEKLRTVSDAMVKRTKKANITIAGSSESSKKLVKANKISYQFGDHKIIDNFSCTICRGDRIGLIGNNGVGKSTLLKLFLGELTPTTGTIKIGNNIDVAYYSQINLDLDNNDTVADCIADGNNYITINNKPQHVIGYLKNFLFSPEQARSKVGFLSGGEKNRVSLAKILSKSSNLLILDEPTNDLDVELIEVLEEQISNYTGTVLLVSHDRDFLDNCINRVLVFEEQGLNFYEGGYRDWQTRGHKLESPEIQNKPKKSASNTATKPKPKTSYKDKVKADKLLSLIDKIEKQITTLSATVAKPDFYDKDFADQKPTLDELEQKQKDLEKATNEWEQVAG